MAQEPGRVQGTEAGAASAAAAGDAVTVLTSLHGQPINKVAWLDGSGELRKAFAKNDGAFGAQTVRVDGPEAMAELLRRVGADPASTICPGLFTGAPDGQFGVLAEAELAKMLKIDHRGDQDEFDAAIKGFHEVNGVPTTCRRAINMTFGSWLPFDRDHVRGTPEELAALDRAGWLDAMDLLIQGMADSGHVLAPSGSSRIMRDGVPLSSNYHFLVQVADPAEISRVWPQLLLKAFDTCYPPWEEQALGFMRPLFSRTQPDLVVGHRPWTIFDVTTGSPERLLFEGSPVARSAGLSVAPPAPVVRPGPRLDLSLFVDVQEPAVERFQRATGEHVAVKRSAAGRVCGVSFTSPTLSLDQELITRRHGTATVGELVAKDVLHEPCQTPWRPESTSWASFLGRHKNGAPFVYDSGTSTKYVLAGEALFPETTHDSLALDLTRAWGGDGRHVSLWGRWLFWGGSTWRADETLQHMTRTRVHLRQLGERAVELFGEKSGASLARMLRNKAMIAAVVDLARSNPDAAASHDEWDRDLLLCGAPTCTVDLRSGAARAPERADLITKSLAVDPAPPGAPAPIWRAFLDRVTAGDVELTAYLQRLAGYCLTGEVSEHVLAFAHGGGANGKSVFFGTLAGVMNDYATVIGTEMLMVSIGERHPTEVACLRGARMALGSEVEANQVWAEAKLKKMTGGDELKGRFMHKDFFEFIPQFKLVVFGNKKPSLRGVDEAIRRRLHLIPFTVTIPPAERDMKLPEKLKAEWPGILRWMIDGCLEWQRLGGLKPPASVVAATEDYLGAEDLVERWREECLAADRDGFEPTALLWLSWQQWAELAGEKAGSKRRFSDQLADHGLARGEHGKEGTRGFHGVKLRNKLAEAIGGEPKK